MDESTRQRAAEELARDHKINVETVRELLDYWEEARGFGWMDTASRKRVLRRAERLDALREELLAPGDVRHAVDAGAPEATYLLEQVAAQLRGLTEGIWSDPGPGQSAPGPSPRVRPDELLLVWEATDIFGWAHPGESLGLNFDPNTHEPASPYTKWIHEVREKVRGKELPRSSTQHLLKRLRALQEWDGGPRIVDKHGRDAAINLETDRSAIEDD